MPKKIRMQVLIQALYILQVAVIWFVQNQYADDVPVDRMKQFQAKLMEFLTNRKPEVLQRIARERAIGDGLKTDLVSAAEEFKQGWS